ncbi:DUF4430 domain-containing protein [Bacillus salitolerans]|uniref:DUF4430 domain-containing protein n=1 Tax=Bacillus salitolerans TaxID=1437434 RepID=A0ABW4LTW2_9BACI
MIVSRSLKVFTLLFLMIAFVSSGYQPTIFAAENTSIVSIVGSQESGTLEKEVSFPEGATAFDVLSDAVGAENVLFEESEYGKYITSINEIKAEGTHYWGLYINGITAQVGADSYIVQDGDKLTFQYIDWNVAPEKTVSLNVIGNDEKGTMKEVSEVSFLNEPTAFELLQVILGVENVLFSESEYGKMITAVNNLAAEGTYYWAFYVNGEMATVGADSYKLQSGDKITFQYESWETSAPEKENSGETETKPETKPVDVITSEKLQSTVNLATKYILANNIGEWEVIGLSKAGKEIPASYLEEVKNVVTTSEGQFTRITDYERYTLGILAAGGNPTDFEGYNLVEHIYNGDVTKQGLNGVIFALLALDSAKFEVPKTATWTREKLVSSLIENQNQDGGWAWDGSESSDIDTTAMVITALAPYKNQVDVNSKIDLAVQYLSAQYLDSKVNNSSTAAQVIIALTALGMNPTSELFSNNGQSIVSYLLTFQNADGGFDYQGGEVSDVFSTDQAFRGVVAYHLFLNGEGSLYNLPLKTTDSNDETVVEPQPTQEGKPLPETATNAYNIILLGLLLLLIGAVMYVSNRKKQGTI